MIKVQFEKTASLDVDMQNGFSENCPDELPVTGAVSIVEELNKTAKLVKYRIGSKDWHHPEALHIADENQPQFSPVGLPNIDIKWNRHCIAGTFGAELIEGLPHWIEYDFFVWKGIEKDVHVYGCAFHDLADTKSTGLIEWLKVKEITTVIINGLAQDFCVSTTALQLRKAGFEVILNLAGTKAINAPIGNGETTLTLAMKKMEEVEVKFIDSCEDLLPYHELKKLD